MVAEEKINMEISQRFPQDANKNWSQETLKKAKDELKTAYAVERIDPNDVIANDGIAKFESFYRECEDRSDRGILRETNLLGRQKQRILSTFCFLK